MSGIFSDPRIIWYSNTDIYEEVGTFTRDVWNKLRRVNMNEKSFGRMTTAEKLANINDRLHIIEDNAKKDSNVLRKNEDAAMPTENTNFQKSDETSNNTSDDPGEAERV